MAGALTPEARWALIRDWGTEDNAIDKALELGSPELRELWESQYAVAWWPRMGDFWSAWWKDALPVLGLGHLLPREHGDAADLLREISDRLAATPRPEPHVGQDPPTAPAPDLSGRPLPALPTVEALKLYAEGETIRGVVRRTELKYKLARRVSTWHESAAVRWNRRQQKPIVAPGYELVPLGRTLRLIRIGPD